MKPFACLLLATLAACAEQPASAGDDWQFADDTDDKADAAGACTVTAPPSSLHLDPFYAKYCSANGIPIVASSHVPDAALHQAKRIVLAMLAPHADVRAKMIAEHQYLMILGSGEKTTDLPEERGQPATLNARTRAIFNPGPPPNAFTGEENVLCYERDGWRGENLYVHEFGHALKEAGFEMVDPSFAGTVQSAFDAAIAAGKYKDLYASSDVQEYWAEGLQSYFNVHTTWDPNDINTRDRLAAYDPTLFAIIDAKFHAVHLPAMCPPAAFAAGSWYRVQNVAAGTGYSLDDEALHATDNVTGQHWHLTANSGGTFRFTNMDRGSAQSLDITNDGTYTPEMAASGNYTGQAWTITPITTGRWRLVSTFQPDKSLAVRGHSVVLEPTADVDAQAWTIRTIL
jgi:alpha-glucosidase